ncbi:MAG: response regulator [Armatimonadetes bacterium]|nr:response regulator [Armatimonadota bacterium]
MPRVLIVDDDPSVCRLVADGLCEEGIECDEAYHGEEALRKLCQATAEGRGYDAMVLDIVMPVIDGWHVLSAVKNNPLWSGMKVVVLTGHATSDEDVARISEYNGVFVEKKGPFPHLLEVILARLLSK